jgi:ABC-type amino acid transport substrate-binding protein
MELVNPRTGTVADDEAGPNPAPLQRGEGRLERIRRTGEIRVGYVPRTPPFSYRNGNGGVVGLDVDLATSLAEILDVTLRLVPYDRPDLSQAFAEDHFDIAIGGIASSLDGFDDYYETIAYLDLHVAVVTHDHRVHEFKSLDAIRSNPDLRMAYVITGHLAQTKRYRVPDLELVQIPSYEPFLRGELSDIDALMTTAETGAVMAMLFPEFGVVAPSGVKARVPMVFALQRDAELERYVDRWLRLQKEDATLDELYDHWILGKQHKPTEPRWSILRNVLGWSD